MGEFMKKVIILIATVIFIGVVVLSLWWTGTLPWSESDDESITPPRLIAGLGSNPSWTHSYDSADEICADSDIIVVGVADYIIKTREEGSHLYISYWSFKIDKVIKGEKTGEITVVQMGSSDVPGSDIKSDPLFIPGDRYLLFLKESSSGSYSYHPQGRFFIWKDRVYSMNHILEGAEALGPVPGLNCNGDELDTVVDIIGEMTNAFYIYFTRYESRIPGEVMRYEAGTTFQAYASLSTGNNGPGKATIRVIDELVPEGVTVIIRPVEFDIRPYSEYESIIIIMIGSEVEPGSCRIPFEYTFEGNSGIRAITLNVDPPFVPPSDEELIRQGLKPPIEENNE